MPTKIFILKTTFFTFLFLCGALTCYAQEAGANFIERRILEADPEVIFDSTTRYVFDDTEISRENLSGIKPGKVKTIQYISKKRLGRTLLSDPSGMVIINSVQTDKSKQDILKRVGKLSDRPALIIDGNLIPPSDWEKEIKRIKPKGIFEISYIQDPIDIEIYGEAGKYGGVAVITKRPALPVVKVLR